MNLNSTTAKAATMMMVLFSAAVFSVQGQGMKEGDGMDNSGYDANHHAILIAQGVNVEAKAMKLHHTINSPYEDLKPRR